jgi:hypothetical protein
MLAAGCFIKPSPPGIDVDAAVTGNVAFVSSATIVPGALGGISAGDMVCQSLANTAKLPGTYVAWLSDSTTNAVERLAGSQGWYRIDGKPFANTVDDLAHGRVLYPLRITDQNVDLVEGGDGALLVATGTGANGMHVANADCSGFASTAGTVVTGEADAGGPVWTAATVPGVPNCEIAMHLYCFGTGQQVTVGVVPESTKLAFVTTAPIAIAMQVGTDVGAFDMACMTEAQDASLTGTFRAAVATTTAAARTRVTSNGPWVRHDGITTIRSDFVGLAAPILQDAHGNPILDGEQVWSGATSLTTKTQNAPTDNCSGWGVVTSTALVGDPSRSDGKNFDVGTKTCSMTAHLYCLQD